ncbi:hypothetical protein DFR58_10385 [Anaerobacterium chartisolvens]|uniref:Uncharacterized protein n=1 Tax=Anaerobacterium chartisolvens TaxID=1297424 RepID=A0A369BCR4_9FIRM|nr:hypothetical protein [Anaerobacterium chartisolvens]RCX19340.1 hypothetical protein DFR58_10385 [Anaerobacterium chartisolvens]
MKKEDIKKSFDNIEPNDHTVQRMLNQILNHSEKSREVRWTKFMKINKAVLVLTMVLVVAGGSLLYHLVFNNGAESPARDGRFTESDLSLREPGMILEMKDQFQIGNKHYIILSEALQLEFGLPGKIDESDIGDRIATISTSVDKTLIGLDVFDYLPAGGKAVVAVKKENRFILFKFYAFDSYLNNQDEDTGEYLKLYGIYSSEDIAKIQFIGYSDKAKMEDRVDIISEITDSGKIDEFYGYYSVIENSSKKYFDRLLNYKSSYHGEQYQAPKQDEIPPDYAGILPLTDLPEGEISAAASDAPKDEENSAAIYKAEDLPDTPASNSGSDNIPVKGEEGSTSVSSGFSGMTGSAGDALNNQVTIRIYNQKGLYYESIYYPNIGFISRHEVNEAFESFLKDYISR